MEIEKLKNDGNERRSDRARKTSARLRTLADEADRRLVLREKSPRLVLLLPPPLAEVDEERILGHALHDYRIVEETRLIAAAVGDACLLTNDIGPRLRAERRGMTVSHVGEDWLLPRESSMLEKRVAKLERAVAERGTPIIHARLFAPDHPDLHFTATTFEVPPDELVEALCTWLTQHEVAEAQREVDRATRSFYCRSRCKVPRIGSRRARVAEECAGILAPIADARPSCEPASPIYAVDQERRQRSRRACESDDQWAWQCDARFGQRRFALLECR